MTPVVDSTESDLQAEVIALRLEVQQLQAAITTTSPTVVASSQTVSNGDAPPPYTMG
jgi:hypothetical protein